MSVILGLDPGVHTGLAVFQRGELVELATISPASIYSALVQWSPKRVIFEDSRLQSHSWTTHAARAAALKMARNIGEVDGYCRIIVDYCELLGIMAHGVSPKGKGAKMDADSFRELTGWQGRTNQHERDSAMVCWPYRRAHA